PGHVDTEFRGTLQSPVAVREVQQCEAQSGQTVQQAGVDVVARTVPGCGEQFADRFRAADPVQGVSDTAETVVEAGPHALNVADPVHQPAHMLLRDRLADRVQRPQHSCCAVAEAQSGTGGEELADVPGVEPVLPSGGGSLSDPG